MSSGEGGCQQAQPVLDRDMKMSQPAPAEPDYLTFALELIQDAGRLALSLQEQAKGVRKPDRTLVSEADFAVQSFLREEIARRFPTHAFVGEENDGIARLEAGVVPDALWIVDPVDGTDSFLRRLPTWAISLGLAVAGQPRLGVVALPATGEVFYAEAGGEAFRDGQRIQVSDDPALDPESTLLTPSQLHLYVDISFPGKLRSYGSTCAHLCYVAAGTVHAAVFGGARPWDVFAAGIVLEAAGGGMFHPDGSRLDLGQLARERTTAPVVVASPPALARPVYESLRLKR